MAQYQYLSPDNVAETFRTSRQYTEGLTDNFPEFERLMRNKPHPNIPKEYPKTTDGTTASIIRKTPHRIIQQLPTGKVKGHGWLPIVAGFIYNNEIIPHANEGYALLQKCWMVVERFLGFGYCPTYAPFVNHGGYFCTDLRLPYWGDIFLQPGKLSDEDSAYIFLRSWWQTKDIDALISAQEKLKKPTWDVEALRAVKDLEVTKDEKAKTPIERETRINTKGGIELITGFQRGVGAKFYTFHVQTTGKGDKAVTSGTIVRTKTNKDPRGELPISFAYGDVDGSNPFGRSVIELVGGLQNLLDGEMQMYQYNRALQLNPPLIKRGNFSKNKIKFAPNVIIDVGADPNATVEPLVIDTTALQNWPNTFGLLKSEMLNLLASPDTSISAEVGNPGFSKTDTGVKASQANLSIDDNYTRKQFETWYERWSETAINLYFAERQGIETLQLDQKTADELRKLAQKGQFDPELLSEDNQIQINYSSATPALKFEVDASTSKKQDELQQLQASENIVAILDKSPFLQGLVPPNKQIALYNQIIGNANFDNPEDLQVNDEELKAAIAQRAEAASQHQPREFLPFKDIVGVAPQAAAKMLEQAGLPSQELLNRAPQPVEDPNAQAPQDNGLTPEHILAAHKQSHDQEMDKAKLGLEAAQVQIAAKDAETRAKVAAKPVPKPTGKK